MSRAWWYQVWFLTACAVSVLAGLLSRIGRAGHPMAAQLAIVVAIILVIGGVAALKGRRAGIEVRQDGITVRRAWGPNRRVRWDEVRGQVKVRRAIGNTVSGPNYWLTFIALLLDNGHKVKTLGLATRQHSLLRTRQRVRLELTDAQEQLSGLGIQFVYQRYNPPLARLLKRHGDGLA
ncbi:MAG TPA: hypothetical protein VKS82_12320 [Streptosporangiaceae bacterium]|nr:hypothetical protein [Streptosporangiaceae bacterium]